jgi:L-lactate dehydrogenase complex protein LldG
MNDSDHPQQRQPTEASTHSRTGMLDRLRTHPIEGPPLPEVDQQRLMSFDDPLNQFIETLKAVGGEAHLVDAASEVQEILAQVPIFAEAERIASVVPEAVVGNLDAKEIADPHALKSLDWTIARGEFVVAENGAIWVEGKSLPHRVMLFIAQYLAIVVSRQQIVDNMHDAYRRIGKPESAFGIFVSGPSKTADIEQSLVLGAHGCRRLQVFLTP